MKSEHFVSVDNLARPSKLVAGDEAVKQLRRWANDCLYIPINFELVLIGHVLQLSRTAVGQVLTHSGGFVHAKVHLVGWWSAPRLKTVFCCRYGPF
jgi:hypothetical protein